MHALMHSQGRSLNKLLSTLGPVANMGSNSAVNALWDSLALPVSLSAFMFTYRGEQDHCVERIPCHRYCKDKP